MCPRGVGDADDHRGMGRLRWHFMDETCKLTVFIFTFMTKTFPPALFTFAVLAGFGVAATPVQTDMLSGVENFLASLTAEQKAKASFGFDDAERKNWHFIPRVRQGLPLKEMTHEQRLLAQALFASGMSSRGYGKAVSIMSLEAILAEMEKGQTGKAVRDSENYFFSIFGTPSVDQPWGWRMEGHHLSFNFTSTAKDVTVTPSFMGANPGEVRDGARKGIRVMGQEEDLGRELVNSLSSEQRGKALINATAPKDVLNDPARLELTAPEGVPYSEFNEAQRALAERLVREYIGRHRSEVEAAEWERIRSSELAGAAFAWAGGFKAGEPHYYRFQGKNFVIEFDNTQNGANHPHAVWRDRNRDFGVDPLKAHYEKAHKK